MSYNAFSPKYPIDIVVLWVDGSDPNWLKEKSETLKSAIPLDNEVRYRDWGLMRYWFRGIEKFAPWVNRIHFVTWGHLPVWLNFNHPKLNIVNHKDYMPKEALPSFNSNSLLVNIHRIPNLAEHFILFNDDTLLIRKAMPEDFFKHGLPRTKAIHCPYRVDTENPFYPPLNDTAVINKYFSMKKSIITNIFKWINPLNGISTFSTLLMLPFPAFYGFVDDHLPSPYIKSTFNTLWEKEAPLLIKTTLNKKREPTDLNEWVVKYWQISSGSFFPPTRHLGKAFFPTQFSNSNDYVIKISNFIKNQQGIAICINDGDIPDKDLPAIQEAIKKALETILPSKSLFEK